MWAGRVTVVVFASVPLGVANAQSTSPAPVTPPPVVGSPVSALSSAPPYIPPEARGYRLTDSAKSRDASVGVKYVYKHNYDIANVSVVPWGGNRPVSVTDTQAAVKHDAELVKQSIEDAVRQHEMQNYAQWRDLANVLHVGGRSVNYYRYFVGFQRRGESAVFLYYAVYALPYGLVRVRAELPWTGAANLSETGTHSTGPPAVGNFNAIAFT